MAESEAEDSDDYALENINSSLKEQSIRENLMRDEHHSQLARERKEYT